MQGESPECVESVPVRIDSSLTTRRARFDEECARRSLNRLTFSERVTVGEIENGKSDACHLCRSESHNGFIGACDNFPHVVEAQSCNIRVYSGRGRGLCSALCWTVLARRSDAVPNRLRILSAT